MRPRATKTDPGLLEIIKDQSGTSFSTTQVRDIYLARFGLTGNQTSSELRAWLYRKLRYLEKRGVLKRSAGSEGDTVFNATELFDTQPGEGPIGTTLPAMMRHTEAQSPVELRMLKEKLRGYEVDMLAAKGEYAEYLCTMDDYPHLRSILEPYSKEARETSSELMGQIRAITKILDALGNAQ